MKYFIIPILLFTLTALNFLSDNIRESNSAANQLESKSGDSLSRYKRISQKNTTIYYSNLKFLPDKNIVLAETKIIWKNFTNFPAKNLYFNFKRNFDNANNNLTAGKNNRVTVTEFACSRKSSEPVFDKSKSETTNGYWTRIDFTNPILPGDSVSFSIGYKLPISSSFDSLNYAGSEHIFIDDQWYPRIPLFKNGKWEIYPKSLFTKEFRSFADFNLIISAPVNYNFITSGSIKEKKDTNGFQHLEIVQSRVSDFVIICTKNINILNNKYQIKDNLNVELNIYIPKKYKEYSQRIKNAATNSFIYLGKNIGNYPYKKFSILYLPQTDSYNRTAFSNVITISSDMFLSGDSYYLEELIAQKIVEQYFHFITANNSQTEDWLSDGISKYIAEKIKLEYYNNSKATFQFLKYISVNGLQFLSYKGIPLIYTLGDYQIPQEALSLNDYYSGYMTGSISDSSYLFINKNSYSINSTQKPFLMLLSLERIIGKAKVKNILEGYYSNFRFGYPSNADLFKTIRENTNALTSYYLNQVYSGFDYYDLKIKYLNNNNKDKYELVLESSGHCNFIADVFVYTDSGTLKFKWNTIDKWKVIRFTSNKNVSAAEIDPTHKYIFDSNYSNNSFTINRMNWASISISIRWFFWIQNALMILGSAA